MALLRDSPDDLLALCGAAAGTLGIPEPAFVEKDFWVVELLRSVVQPLELEPMNNIPCSAAVMFKGGTSLSKAYGLIKRFSEDVDILVACEGYGVGARETRVLRPICERAGRDLGLLGDQIRMLDYQRGFTRNADYLYPSSLRSAAIRPSVRLEMGIRGGILPGTQRRRISSYIADYVAVAGVDADYEEFAPVEVDVIAPVRTLAEKLALLHHAGTVAARGNPVPLQRAGRHFYDVHDLLLSPDVVAALSVPGQTMDILATDVDEKSAEFGWDHTPRPGEGYSASIVFEPSGPVQTVAEDAYRSALSLIWGDPPTSDQCLARIREAENLL
jgi:hypothetical protein